MSETLEQPLAQSTGVSNPLVLLQSMIERGADPDALKKMMDLAERWEQNQASKAFAEAMTACQQDMPAILRDKQNTHTQSWYARYESLNAAVKPIYTKHGFSLSFGEEPCDREGMLRIFCNVQHRAGHTKRYQGDFPRDGTGIKGNANMTAIQATGSTYSYAKRYLQKNIWNLAEADEDNDGNPQMPQYIDQAQMEELDRLFAMLGVRGNEAYLKDFLKWLKVESLHQIDQTKFDMAVAQLNRNYAKKQGGKP